MYRILIADSDSVSLQKTKSLLDWSAYGFGLVLTADSYTAAVSIALDRKPHVILVPSRLGEHRGYALAEQLRAMGSSFSLCVLSSGKDPDEILGAMRAGARDFLPPDPESIGQFLERIVVEELEGSLPEPVASGGQTDPVLQIPYADLSKITNKILLLVKSDYRSPQTLKDIAEGLHMSSKYIGRVFLKDTGIKFSEYLMAYRMLEAKKLILTTQEKISAIASMVGYVQQNNFYTHFKNFFGVSPSALRNYEAPQDSPENTAVQGERI